MGRAKVADTTSERCKSTSRSRYFGTEISNAQELNMQSQVLAQDIQLLTERQEEEVRTLAVSHIRALRELRERARDICERARAENLRTSKLLEKIAA